MGAQEAPVVDRGEKKSGIEGGGNRARDIERGIDRMVSSNHHVAGGEGQERVIRPQTAATNASDTDYHTSMLQSLNPSNPLRIAMNSGGRGSRGIRNSGGPATVPATTTSRVVPPPHVQPAPPPLVHPSRFVSPPQAEAAVPFSPPTSQQSSIAASSLNSRRHTNKIALFLFLLHLIAAIGLVAFLIFKGVQGLLQSKRIKRNELKIVKYFLPQIEASSLLSITLAFTWQKSVRHYPIFMVHFILWSSFITTLSSGILLICFQEPSSTGVGVALLLFSIGNGLYSCWVTQRTGFCTKVLMKSLEPVSKFHDINRPTYMMLAVGFLWMNLWILGVIGSLNFYFPWLVIFGLVLSLAWITEVMRNVANLTVSRVISLYYLRGIQSSTQFCFQRVLTRNLGSACLGSLFVPAIEALRIVARGLNLLEGEDEFMFSCAHCCLRVMQSIFRFGNGWAYVQIAAYGKNFVKASQDTWTMFERQEMEVLVDSDITTSVCFLSGVCSGSICVIVVAPWTFTVHQSFTATVSLLAFFIGYLMTRIAMALPHACVSCYYVCYAEHPESRLFDKTIPERLHMIKTGRDTFVPTPRVPRRFMK